MHLRSRALITATVLLLLRAEHDRLLSALPLYTIPLGHDDDVSHHTLSDSRVVGLSELLEGLTDKFSRTCEKHRYMKESVTVRTICTRLKRECLYNYKIK